MQNFIIKTIANEEIDEWGFSNPHTLVYFLQYGCL